MQLIPDSGIHGRKMKPQTRWRLQSVWAKVISIKQSQLGMNAIWDESTHVKLLAVVLIAIYCHLHRKFVLHLVFRK